MSDAEYEHWRKELSNWGRRGAADQIGALNLITPAKQAADLVKEGFAVSLAADAHTVEAVDNPTSYEHTMLAIGSDSLAVTYHGIAHTHVDVAILGSDHQQYVAPSNLRGAVHDLRWSISGFISSTTAISRRWPMQRPRATDGSSC